MFHAAVVAGLTSTGCDVLDLGVCPAGILQFCVERHSAAGAVAVTGGHTRAGYNALTLIGPNGAFLEPVGGETVLDIYHARDFHRSRWDRQGVVRPVPGFETPYFDALEALLDAAAIRKAGFTAVVDPVNGAGCRFVPQFADRLGIRTVTINGEESGFAGHDPEPRPRNAKQVSAIIRHAGADVGFVSSSDMSRVCIVCDNGETASEEYTLALAARHVLERKPGVLVTNCCTSRMVDDVARLNNSSVVKTPVGQAYIMSALADEQGVIGGEGNGSVALPAFSRAFDAFLAMGLILEAMARSGLRASELLAGLPRYHIVKRQVSGEPHRCYRAIEALQEDPRWLGGGSPDTTDGVRLDREDGWIHVRASRTEPMIRITSESSSRQAAEGRAEETARRLEAAL
jgi:phosphomannomutase